jgi:hypothetical protein
LQINPDESKWNIGARDVQFVLMRKEAGEYWDKLQKGSKITTLKVDWDKWKDEDEVDEKVNSSQSTKKPFFTSAYNFSCPYTLA